MNGTRLGRALSAPLLWRVVPWLFLGVMLAELAALYPMVLSYRQTLYDYRARVVHSRAEGLAELHAVAPAMLPGALRSAVRAPVQGLALYDSTMRLLARHGRFSSAPPSAGVLPPPGAQKVGPRVLALSWSGNARGRAYHLLAEVDVSEETRAVERFVREAGLLSLPAALVATLVGSFTLIALVVVPVLRLRDELLERAAAYRGPGDEGRRSLDELDQLRVLVERLEEARALARAESERAESANRAKDEFLANMSHELQAPLSSIVSYAELLSETLRAEAPDAERDLSRIIASARHVSGLVGNILTFSKLEADRMLLDLGPCDVRQIAEDAAAMALPLVRQNDNEFLVELPEEPLALHSDAVKIRQSLLNLLSNAAKFTRGGRVRLSVTRERDGRHERVVLTVEDTGIGMSDAEIGRVFEPFVQADSSTTRRYGGTGLGLSIAKRFAVMLGGGLEVESRPGQGSRFSLWLPRAADSARPSAPDRVR